MKNKITLFLFFSSLVLQLFSFSVFSYADNIEEATRETNRLSSKEIEEKIKTIPQKAVVKQEEKFLAPQGAKEEIFIKKLILLGCQSLPLEKFSYLIKEYENQKVNLSELDAIAKEIEREYLRNGIISAVFVPEQEIKDGVVTLQIVEAKMGQLEIPKHKYYKSSRLNYYWAIPEGQVLRYDLISKSLQMMNKNPDRQVKAALKAGEKAGTTDIVLSPEASYPAHITATFDREGSIATGVSRSGIGFRHNNFLGFDDILLTGYAFGRDFSGRYAYHNLPVSPNGASLLYGYSKSESVPTKEYSSFGLNSAAENFSLSLRQDIYEKDVYRGEAFVKFDAKDKTVKLNDNVYNRDRLRILGAGMNFVYRKVSSTVYFSPEFSQGLDAFGASSKGNPFASRGAKSVFSKLATVVQYKETWTPRFQSALKIQTQVSSTKLMPQEQFSLGGIDSVRGYPSGDYLADNAATAGAEMLWKIKQPLTALAFLDFGWGARRGILSDEKKSVKILGVGPGLRINLFDQAMLRLEWGFPIAGQPLTAVGHSYFHFSVDFQEKLPTKKKLN